MFWKAWLAQGKLFESSTKLEGTSQGFNLDVDGDGKVTAFGDGLMVIRKLFGGAFAGDALTNKAISSSSPYYDNDNAWESVANHIDAMIPTEPLA